MCVRACARASVLVYECFLGLIFNLSDQPYMHWNVNTIDTQFPTSFGTSYVPLWTNSKDTNVTYIRTPCWWHSGSAETCRILCIYCVHIAVHKRLFDRLHFASCTVCAILKIILSLRAWNRTKSCQVTRVPHRISVSLISAVKLSEWYVLRCYQNF